MKDILRPVLELLVVLPGLLLGYFPVKTYLKQSPGRLAAWLFPLMACLCIGSGLACYRLGASTFLALAGVALAAICLYTRTLTISLWKSGTIALSVCAVFACVNPNIAPPMTVAIQSGRSKPDARDTAIPIGVIKVMVPTEVPIASDTKQLTTKSTTTAN